MTFFSVVNHRLLNPFSRDSFLVSVQYKVRLPHFPVEVCTPRLECKIDGTFCSFARR